MQADQDQHAHADAIAALAGEIDRLTRRGDTNICGLSSLTLHRRTAPAQPMPCIYGFGLGVVAQGGKRAMLNGDIYDYRPGDAMLTTVDVPVVANVTIASTASPFLGLVLPIDPRTVLDLTVGMAPQPVGTPDRVRSLAFGALDTRVLQSMTRLLRLADEPLLAPQLASLIGREIVIRLLHSGFGAVLRQVAVAGSPNRQIARAVDLLKQHFTQAMRIDELAESVHMSPSTFRQHFRKVTGMSPLQYQKRLRLQEARQLLLSQHLDAGSASIRVGYDSASQFSREYTRLFGLPPLRDVQQARRASIDSSYADMPPSITSSALPT